MSVGNSIIRGTNGFRVPPDDVEALRLALRRLVEDRMLRERIGERSREFSERFTPPAWAEAVAARAGRLARQ